MESGTKIQKNKLSNKYEGPLYFLIPELIDKELSTLADLLKYIPGFTIDNLKEIISIIVYHTPEDNNRWTPLKTIYLRSIVPNAEIYLRALMDLEIIERTDYYEINKTCYKYRFSEQYLSKCKRYPLTNQKLRNRIKDSYNSFYRSNSKMYPCQNDFIRQMTIKPEAIEDILKINDPEKFNYALVSYMNIIEGNLFYHVDSTGGRYHSNLVNLPKQLRQYVRIQNKPLVNIDLKNSQPFLSIILLTNPKKVSFLAQNKDFSLLLESLQVTQTEDVKKYVYLVTEGRFYEYLMNEFEKREIIMTRDQVKEQTFIILFSRNSMKSKTRTIFKELFPEVHRVFSLIRGNDYKRFPVLLQRIESYLILKIILNRINRENPEIITATIHDSIMTTKENSKKVKKIMFEEILNFVGQKPNLKIEVKESKESKIK